MTSSISKRSLNITGNTQRPEKEDASSDVRRKCFHADNSGVNYCTFRARRTNEIASVASMNFHPLNTRVPSVRRVPELLEGLKAEYDTLLRDTNVFAMQRDEYEKQRMFGMFVCVSTHVELRRQTQNTSIWSVYWRLIDRFSGVSQTRSSTDSRPTV